MYLTAPDSHFFVEMHQVFGRQLRFPDEVNYKIDETYCVTYFGLKCSDLNPWTAVALPFPSNTLHLLTVYKQCPSVSHPQILLAIKNLPPVLFFAGFEEIF